MASPKPYLFFLFVTFSATVSASLSTLAISQTPNQTVICALIPGIDRQSFISCTVFPENQTVNLTPNVSFSAIAAGNGFLCAARSPPAPAALHCWNFPGYFSGGHSPIPLRSKRVSKNLTFVDLEAGSSHICGIAESQRIYCWRWREFEPPVNQNLTSLAVGDDFLCGLSDSGRAQCYGGNSAVVGSEPAGNLSLLAAGFRRACGVYKNGSLTCWGDSTDSVELPEPGFKIDAIALGSNSSCGWNAVKQIVRCWGNDFQLPESLTHVDFLSIEAKGSVFCGIVATNYSVLCWGIEFFGNQSTVFERILPGPCADTCPCSILPGSQSLCLTGNVCSRCPLFSDHTRIPASPALVPATPSPIPTNTPGSNGNKKANLAFLVVGSVGVVIGLVTLACAIFLRVRPGQSSRVHDSGRLDSESPPHEATSSARPSPPLAPTLDKRFSALLSMGRMGKLEEFPLDVLARATDDFSNDNKIGSGSFGSVYRATLEDGREVAVKRAESPLRPSVAKYQDNEHAFLSEIAFLSRVNHKNLVQLLGFCEDGDERVLVYEYLTNGTLHDHLHLLPSSPLTSWTARLKVALDTARGIEYLHTYAVPPIIHRDVKSSNILLDATWTAKVSDFGLSLMSPDDNTSHLSMKAAGTVGYMDPAYYRLQQLTTKSDVYSFGVVLLELLSGYKAIHRDAESGGPSNIVDIVLPWIVKDNIHHVLDPKLPPPTPSEIEAVAYAGYLAADCVSNDSQDRPSMTEIVGSLERALAACNAILVED